jgi:phage baseplate assembly protein W
MTTDYGSDLLCWDDLDEDAREVEGVDVVAQDAYHELISPRGSILEDPDAGAGVRTLLQQKVSPGFVASIPGRLANAIQRDPRIDAASGKATSKDGGQSVECELHAETGEGPFRLVFVLTEDTITRITEDT